MPRTRRSPACRPVALPVRSRAFGWACGALLAVLAISGVRCFAASPYQPVRSDPLLEAWRWRTFPELNGLGAHSMAEGTDGTIWFGTVEGVRSYDGITWAHHPPDKVLVGGVNSVCPAPDGSLYVGGRAGISRFAHGQWRGVFPGTGRPFGEIRKLLVARDNSLWAATAWGLVRFHQDRWICYTDAATAARLRQDAQLKLLNVELLPAAIATRSRAGTLEVNRHDFAELAEDAAGRIWLGTAAGEIITFDPAGGTWGLYNESDGLICGRNPSILPLQNGAVWVVYGAGSGHANVFDGVAWKPFNLADAGVPGDAANLLQTRDGVIWLSGRYVISAYRDGHWRNYQQPEVPIPTARNFLLQSADGALWIGGPGTEIQRVDYETPRWLTLRDLNFQWESPAGAAWFLHRDGRVVVQEGGQWTAYGIEDGLIDAPVALVGARNGEVWAAGSHQQTAATARFDGRQWTRFIHDEFSWGVDWHGVLATADGSVWFAAAVDSSGPPQHRHGLLQYRDGVWTHHHQPGRAPQNGNDANPATLLPATQRPEPVGKFLSLGESRDGKIWAGRNLLIVQDGGKWKSFTPAPDIPHGIIEMMFTTRERDLWIGTRQFGALRYDGQTWQRHQGKGSLVANSVRSLAQTADGSVWAATDRDVSRFDGHTWMADLLPAAMNVPQDGGSLKAAPSGALWINHFSPDWTRRAWSKATPPDPAAGFWTVRHQFKGTPPQTTIVAGSEKISQPGNLSVLWSGAVPWREPRDARLQYSYRLDDEPWSPYTSDQGHAFFTLPSGAHRFEVRARDQDFNVDLTPATLSFTVLPPVWRQTWFIVLMALLTGSTVAQSVRVFLERARLRASNRELAAEVKVRERAEDVLRISEERLSTIFHLSPTAICIVRVADQCIVDVNEAFLRNTGYTREEIIGRTPIALRLWEDPAERAAVLTELDTKGSVVAFKMRVRRKAGEIGVGLISMTRIALNGEAHFLSLIQDIDELERAEQAQRETDQRFRQVTENIDEVFWLTDVAKQQMIYISPAYLRIWGRTCESLYAQPESWLNAIHPDDQALVRQAALTLQAEGKYDLEYRIVRPDGEVRWIHDRASPISDAAGRVHRIAGVAEDITVKRQLEEQVRQAQKMESLGTLAGGIAHDFNNILTGVLGSAEIAQMELPADHPARPWVAHIAMAGKRARALVQQILTFGRKHEFTLVPRKIQIEVSEALRLLRATIPSTVRIESKIDAMCPPVVADDTQIHQVVMNLCTNAWHALPPTGGLIEVTLLPVLVTLGMAAKKPGLKTGQHVRLTVRDNGCGMSPETAARIFEPFFTTKEKGQGTGLGLAVVHGIVQSHHGAIFVASAPHEGTLFEVFLPAIVAPALDPAHAPAEPIVAGRQEHILLVDDDPVSLAALRGQLEHIGYRVTAMSDAPVALKLFLLHPASFDLVLTDYTMPGLSGEELSAQILAARPDCPIILTSGFADPAHIRSARALGVRDFVRKPVPLSELSHLIARHVRRVAPA